MAHRDFSGIRRAGVVLISIAFFLVANSLDMPEWKLAVSTVFVFFGLSFVILFPAPTE
jgi:hypothetical protein